MQNFSYTKSFTLTEQLNRIDELRRQILLYPLSPLEELELQWNSESKRIHYSLALNGIIVTEQQIHESLSLLSKKAITPYRNNIISHKKMLDHLYHHWLVSKNPVTTDALLKFFETGFAGSLQIPEETLANSLNYIQINPEHPVIQAALGQILILTLSPFSEFNEQFSHFVFLLFMYKYGYDMRRMPVYSEYYFHDLANYKDMITKSSRQQNITTWLEYVAHAIISQLQKTVSLLQSQREQPQYEDELFDLNDRQKAIIDLFNQPGVKVSNKIVQRLHKVSQITASRDLSKLAQIGIIFAVGKGRSTYYTKV